MCIEEKALDHDSGYGKEKQTFVPRESSFFIPQYTKVQKKLFGKNNR